MRKPVFGGFQTRPETNQAVQPLKIISDLGSRGIVLCCEKDSYLRLCFSIGKKQVFSEHYLGSK